jgi:hypothetical protein
MLPKSMCNLNRVVDEICLEHVDENRFTGQQHRSLEIYYTQKDELNLLL